MTKRLKYEIYGANGNRIEADVIHTVDQPLNAFASVDWNEQLQIEVRQGAAELLEWPAHMNLEDEQGNYLRLMPSPLGLEGSLQLIVERLKFGFIRQMEREQIDFSRVNLEHAERLISDFVLGNFYDLKELVDKETSP